jgi:hypothetical protein
LKNISQLHSHPTIKKGIWDIEEICKIGQTLHACPYKVAMDRFLFYFILFILKRVLNADFVFGPYNYIIDPLIHKIVFSASSVDLNKNIITNTSTKGKMDENCKNNNNKEPSEMVKIFDLPHHSTRRVIYLFDEAHNIENSFFYIVFIVF